MRAKTKAGKYFLLGLLADLSLLLLALVGFLLMASMTYDGQCGLGIIFGSGRHPCTFFEYLTHDMLLVPFLIIACYWWAVLLLLALPPVIGFLAGRRIAVPR